MSVLTVKQQCYGKPIIRHSSTLICFFAITLDNYLSLGESLGETLHVVREVAVVGEELNISTIDLDATGSLLLQVLLAAQRREAPVLGDDDLLSAGELVLGSSKSLESVATVWRCSVSFQERYGDIVVIKCEKGDVMS